VDEAAARSSLRRFSPRASSGASMSIVMLKSTNAHYRPSEQSR
jgi:hypothetical protein